MKSARLILEIEVDPKRREKTCCLEREFLKESDSKCYCPDLIGGRTWGDVWPQEKGMFLDCSSKHELLFLKQPTLIPSEREEDICGIINTDEDIEEKAMVLADALVLKRAAIDYAHPEVGVITSDPSVYDRNHYD